MRGLNPKQKRFVEEYVIDCNATQAAIRAGYSKKTANEQAARLLANVSISTEIQAGLENKTKRTKIDADWIMKRFEQIAERCMQAEPVLDHEGNPTGEYRFDSKGANTALAHMGKHIGMFKDKIELTGKDGGPVELTDMTEEERIKRLMQLLQRAQERISVVSSGRDTKAIGSTESSGTGGSK